MQIGNEGYLMPEECPQDGRGTAANFPEIATPLRSSQ